MTDAESTLISPEMEALAAHVAAGGSEVIPEHVLERGRLHLLDTVAAMVSGSRLVPGVRAREWAAGKGTWAGSAAATVIGGGFTTSPHDAALSNGMSGHADETDDSHMDSLSHPGCGVVPAALAAGEMVGIGGKTLLRAVIAGYDVGCRVGRATALGPKQAREGKRDSHSLVGGFGATAAAAIVNGLDATRVRYAFSYAGQLSSGVSTYPRDTHHVEKAYLFGGMPAAQGILAATLAKRGFDGVEDLFSGAPNWIDSVSESGDRAWLGWELGNEFEVLKTTLKKYAVGSPAQAAVEAAVLLMREDGVEARDLEEITIHLPSDNWHVVNNREMPDINVQYLVVGTFLDGGFTFAMAHDEDRMRDSRITDLLARTTLSPDEEFRGTRYARVAVRQRGVKQRAERTITEVCGRPNVPMSAPEVRDKAMDLMRGPLGETGADEVCAAVLAVEGITDVRDLTRLLG